MVEDPATGLHRPRDYVVSLEARVAYLEGLLQETRPEVAIDHFAGLPRQPQQADGAVLDSVGAENAAPGTSITGHPQQPIHGSDDADESDLLSNEVALLCLGAAGREPQYFGPSSAVHFSRIVSSTLRLPRRGGAGGTTSSHYSNTSHVTGRYQEFPGPGVIAKLSKAYFSNIHPQYPFLHQPTFRLMEQQCLEASLRNDLSAAPGPSLFFVLMVWPLLILLHPPGLRCI